MQMTTRIRVLTRLAAGLSVIALAIAACSGQSSPSSNSQSSAAPRNLQVAFGTKPLTLDPDLAFTPTDVDILHLIGGYLFNLTDGKLSYGLASRYSVSASKLEATVTLRSNLHFSNGESLTSADVVASVERSIHNKANSYAGFFKPITAVTADGELTVVFHLTRPYPDLPTLMAEPDFMIMPAGELNPAAGTAKSGFFNSPISAGPYILKSWGGGNTAVMARNPKYWGPKPIIPQVTFVTVTDTETALNEMRAGELDIAEEIPPSMIAGLAGSNSIRTQSDLLYGWITIVLNNKVKPLNNVNVRRAIWLAVNRKQISKLALSGATPALAGFWPQTMTGYDPSISTLPDIPKAKSLLTGTPCAHGCTIQLDFETGDMPYAAQLVTLFQQDLRAIGINVTNVEMDNSTELDALSTEKFQMGLTYLYDYANIPDGMLAYGLQGTAGGLSSDFSQYNSSQMNGLIARADEATGQSRSAILSQISRLFVSDAPYLTLTPYVNVYASRISPSIAWTDHSGFVQVKSE